MPITICPYSEEHVEAVGRFNGRLRAGGATAHFPLSPVPSWLPKAAGRRLFQEYYLAVDDEAVVRGAYILKHQDFWIKDRTVAIADLQLPLSEGTVNRHYPQVGVQLLRDALGRQPLLFGLGIGGYSEPLARVLMAAGWSMFSVPFHFRVVHPQPFLRSLVYLRRHPVVRWMFDAFAVTGAGSVGIRGLQAICAPQCPADPAMTTEPVDDFSTWADQIWQVSRAQYGMSAVCDAETLRILYPANDRRFIRLRMNIGGRTAGWAVLLDTALSNHEYFGNMRLGSIVNTFASLADAAQVVRAASAFLQAQGVDLIVSNHSHAAWCGGFRRAGFLRGPSNFLFAASPQLAQLLRQQSVVHDAIHVNRGDGDGPINL